MKTNDSVRVFEFLTCLPLLLKGWSSGLTRPVAAVLILARLSSSPCVDPLHPSSTKIVILIITWICSTSRLKDRPNAKMGSKQTSSQRRI